MKYLKITLIILSIPLLVALGLFLGENVDYLYYEWKEQRLFSTARKIDSIAGKFTNEMEFVNNTKNLALKTTIGGTKVETEYQLCLDDVCRYYGFSIDGKLNSVGTGRLHFLSLDTNITTMRRYRIQALTQREKQLIAVSLPQIMKYYEDPNGIYIQKLDTLGNLIKFHVITQFYANMTDVFVNGKKVNLDTYIDDNIYPELYVNINEPSLVQCSVFNKSECEVYR